jgi:hypothetical protein
MSIAETSIRQLIDLLGMVLGINDKAEMNAFANTVIAAKHSGKLDETLIDNLLDLTKGEAYIISTGRTRVGIINDLISRLLRSLVGQWILSYGKPVITTTFTEEQVRMAGNHYDYTSGNRASRVLVKLLEYHRYLNLTSK